MPKKEVKEKVKAKKLGSAKIKKGAKLYVRDVNDRDFRQNGIDLVLAAGEKKEVSKELYLELKDKFSYLEFIEEV